MLLRANYQTKWSGVVVRCSHAVLLSVVLILGSIYAAPTDCSENRPIDSVQAMLADAKFQQALNVSKGIDPSNTRIVYLVLNHETLSWSVYHSHSRGSAISVSEDKQAVLPGPDGNPRVVRARDEKPVLVVVRTNPFRYSYEATVSPPQYSPDAATMGAALSAIGAANLVMVDDRRQAKKRLDRLLKKGAELSQEERKAKEDAQKRIEVEGVVCKALYALNDMVTERELIQSLVRRLETGDDTPWPPSLEFVAGMAQNGLVALDEFERIAANLPKPRSCYQVWGPLARLAALPNVEEDDLAAARAEMLKINAQGDYRCEEMVKDAFIALEKLEETLRKEPVVSSAESDEQKAVFREFQNDWLIRVALISNNVLRSEERLYCRRGSAQEVCPTRENTGAPPPDGLRLDLAIGRENRGCGAAVS